MTQDEVTSGTLTVRRVVILACSAYRTVYTYYRQVMLGAVEWGLAHNWDIIDISRWNWCIPEGVKPDGMISIDQMQDSLAERLYSAIPHCVAVRGINLPDSVPNIESDARAIGARAAEYYLERGFRNFAIVAYRQNNWDPRMTAFKTKVERTGAQCGSICDLSAIRDESDPMTARKRFLAQLSALDFPLALFCRNDSLGVRVIRWCVEEGIAVPEQVAVLGCGNEILTCQCSLVALSSIETNHRTMGEEAARLLQDMMNGETVHPGNHEVEPSGVITRRSTDIAAIPDLTAARALRYIWDNYRANIGAEDVAGAIGVHRRTLDRHFRGALGRSVAKEITRRRLVAACELLTSSETAIANIAAVCGFSTPQHFNYVFRRSLGMTPQQYRSDWRGPPHLRLLIRDL